MLLRWGTAMLNCGTIFSRAFVWARHPWRPVVSPSRRLLVWDQLRRRSRSAVDALDGAQVTGGSSSADLRAYAAVTDERDLTVRLPYQRGQSLDTLRGLEGRERLWPLVPSRQEDLKAMAAAAMQAGWGRVMVVEDPSALESTSSNAFV